LEAQILKARNSGVAFGGIKVLMLANPGFQVQAFQVGIQVFQVGNSSSQGWGFRCSPLAELKFSRWGIQVFKFKFFKLEFKLFKLAFRLSLGGAKSVVYRITIYDCGFNELNF
jgi:hypothetical protein